MKIIEKALPYVLLVSYLALLHFKTPQIADSIIIIALSALCGYSHYLNSKKTPDYLNIFKEKLEKRDKEIEDIKTTVGIYNISQKNKQKAENIVW